MRKVPIVSLISYWGHAPFNFEDAKVKSTFVFRRVLGHTGIIKKYDSYNSTSLLLLPPSSFGVLFAVVCTVVCALLSNVSFDIHDRSNVLCGIVDIFSMDVLLLRVCHMSHNREGWVSFFLRLCLTFSDF